MTTAPATGWRAAYAAYVDAKLSDRSPHTQRMYRRRNVQNPEVLIKVLDGCASTGHVWGFFAAATNLGFTLSVDDTSTGDRRSYRNPPGNRAVAVTDSRAFAVCPLL